MEAALTPESPSEETDGEIRQAGNVHRSGGIIVIIKNAARKRGIPLPNWRAGC